METGRKADKRIAGLLQINLNCRKVYEIPDRSGVLVVCQDHNDRAIAVGATLAHEMGHNLGMDHDDSSACICSGDSCIMAAALRWEQARADELRSRSRLRTLSVYFRRQNNPIWFTWWIFDFLPRVIKLSAWRDSSQTPDWWSVTGNRCCLCH